MKENFRKHFPGTHRKGEKCIITAIQIEFYKVRRKHLNWSFTMDRDPLVETYIYRYLNQDDGFQYRKKKA